MSKTIFDAIGSNISNATFDAQDVVIQLEATNFYDEDFVTGQKTNDSRVISHLVAKVDLAINFRTKAMDFATTVRLEMTLGTSDFAHRGSFINGNPFAKKDLPELENIVIKAGDYDADYLTKIKFHDKKLEEKFWLDLDADEKYEVFKMRDGTIEITTLSQTGLDYDMRGYTAKTLNEYLRANSDKDMAVQHRIKSDIVRLTHQATKEAKDAFIKMLLG